VELRPYQAQAAADIRAAWARGARNVAAVLPTGAGKTVLFAHILAEEQGATCAIAHRQELVGQISVALAREGVHHRIIGPKNVIKAIVGQHVSEAGASYYSPDARHAVAGVDTLVRRGPQLETWARSVTLWVQDECHHIIESNKWGSAAAMFPSARGLGVTATPCRADGKGLGRHADGLIDEMVVGPSMRSLIDAGYLTDYRIFAPPSDLDLSDVTVGASGDYTRPSLETAVGRSHIIGDVVQHYQRIAPGKLGVTFATSVETATAIAAQYNAAGVPAEVVSAKTPDKIRRAILGRFRARELLQLVNVDLFGEGFDLPAIEAVSMARPTQSYALYCQQFGRALRVMSGKDRAIIIDHVGNVVRHGLPDRAQSWTLDRREKRKASSPDDAIPLRNCLECFGVYERVLPACPYCGHVHRPAERSLPEHVDGDLCELDPSALAALRGDVERVDMDAELYRAQLVATGLPGQYAGANVKRHLERQAAQAELRESIGWWGAWQRAHGRPDAESYRRFWYRFGIDVLSAQALGTTDAGELSARIKAVLQNEGLKC